MGSARAVPVTARDWHQQARRTGGALRQALAQTEPNPGGAWHQQPAGSVMALWQTRIVAPPRARDQNGACGALRRGCLTGGGRTGIGFFRWPLLPLTEAPSASGCADGPFSPVRRQNALAGRPGALPMRRSRHQRCHAPAAKVSAKGGGKEKPKDNIQYYKKIKYITILSLRAVSPEHLWPAET